jgi:DNA-binding CsgD family transcriptional regulator
VTSNASTGPVKSSILYRSALEAFDRAEYGQCAELIELAPISNDAERGAWALLSARCAKAIGDNETWYESAKVAGRDCESHGDRALGLALAAQAALRVSTAREASEFADRVLAAIANRRPRDIAEARYCIAVYRWEIGDVPGAQELARANLADGLVESETTALLGWAAAKEEDYASAGKLFVKALQALHASKRTDARLQSRLILGIAVIASETIDFALGRIAADEFRVLHWPAAHHTERCGTLNALRYLALLQGDLDSAYVFSRQATAGTAPPAYRAIAEIMGAVASRLLGDSGAETIGLRRAWDIVRTERWSENSEEARGALSYFMLEAAESFSAEARKASVIYRSLSPKVDPNSGLHADRRLVAFESMAAGRVAELSNDVASAIAAYEASLEIWQSIGYAMRAAFVALDLLRLTGRKSYRKAVCSALALAPKAWFARDLKKKAKPVELLTPTERVVLAQLIRGKTAREIALALDRSPYTISNHTRKIFAAFGVNSRTKVIANCVRLGVTAASLERSARA